MTAPNEDRPLTAREEAMYHSAARRLQDSWERCGRQFRPDHVLAERIYDAIMDAIPAWKEARATVRTALVLG